MLDACGVTHEYGDVMKKLAGLKLLFEKLCILHCGKGSLKPMAAAVGWSLLWSVHLATDAPLECET